MSWSYSSMVIRKFAKSQIRKRKFVNETTRVGEADDKAFIYCTVPTLRIFRSRRTREFEHEEYFFRNRNLKTLRNSEFENFTESRISIREEIGKSKILP